MPGGVTCSVTEQSEVWQKGIWILSHSFSGFLYLDVALLLIKPLSDPAFCSRLDAGVTAIILL